MMVKNTLDDGRSERSHALSKPLRHTSAMQREIGNSGAFHYELGYRG